MGFPHFPRKDVLKPLISASRYLQLSGVREGGPPRTLPPELILVFGMYWKRYLPRRYVRHDRLYDVYCFRDSVGVVVGVGPGAPLAAIVVEELAARGARRIVMVGTAGSLRPRLQVGSLVVCTKALRDEGTSYHYMGPGVFARASRQFTFALMKTLRSDGVRFASGPTWTTDAPYRETVQEVRYYRKRGLLTVDMEASAVFTVAGICGLEATALFVISDQVDERAMSVHSVEIQPSIRTALRAAERTLCNYGQVGRAAAT